MEEFGIYSLKMTIILTVFWGIYRLFLQKETFFRFNRYFLLAGFATSLLLPLYIIHYTVEVNTSEIPVQMISESEAISSETTNETAGFSALINKCILFLPAFYFIVIIIILIVRIIGYSRLLKIINRSKHQKYTNNNLIESSEFDGAFSFFRFIIIPEGLSESEKNIILKHEEAHIKQNHWMDLLITSILSLIWWFNPIFKLYENAIKNNHEYLVDKEVLSLYNQTDYTQTLLNQWFKTPVFSIINSFSCSNCLKRINMMKKNNSNPAKRLFSLSAIPVIAIFLLACAEKDYVLPSSNNAITSKVQKGTIHEDGSISMSNGGYTIKIDSVFSSDGWKEPPPLLVIDEKPIDIDIKNFVIENLKSVTIMSSEDAIKHYGEKGKLGALIVTTNSYSEK